MAQAPDPAALAKAEQATEPNPVMRIDGKDYVLDPAMLNGRRDAVIYKETGLTGLEAFALLEAGQPAMFAIAALVWVVRDADGEDVSLGEVLDSVHPGMLVEFFEDQEDNTGPPA